MKNQIISIVIPVLNENASLKELVKKLEQFTKKCSNKVEYIFIDDGSTDGSYDVLQDIKKHIKTPCRIFQFRKNLGKSAALSVGFQRAQGDIIVTLDADLQDDPAEIQTLIDTLHTGYDLVVGWREKRNDINGKIHLSRIFNRVVSRFMNITLHDMNCGLKVMSRSVAREIDLYGELHRYIPVLASSRGFRVTELPVKHFQRKFGTSKYGSERILRAAFDLITTLFLSSYKTTPLHIFGLIGSGFIVAGVLPLLYLTGLHFIGVSIGRRPLLLMGILFVLFGVQLFSTGLLGELLVSLQPKKDRYPISYDTE